MERRHDRSSELLASASSPASSTISPLTLPRSDSTESNPATPGARFDVLSEVLRSVRLTGALFFPMEASSPWVDNVPPGAAFSGIILPGAQNVVSYHIVTQGACWASLADGTPVRLETGDILVIPHGDRYIMSSAPHMRSDMPDESVLMFFRHMVSGLAPSIVIEGGGGPDRVEVVCGFLACDIEPYNPVLQALPRLVHVRKPREHAGPDRLSPLIALAMLESRERRPGSKNVLLRLSEILFIEVIRRYVDSAAQTQTGWLAGLNDLMIGRALALLHDRPADPWTLKRLSNAIGVSRSTLADHFTHVVGQPPMRYLAQWRMQLATRLLAEGSAKVCAVALDVGYQSEAAFSRAFKDASGMSPAAWRKRSRR